jgi:hypothetical protein
VNVFFHNPCGSWADLESRWQEMNASHGLLFILCHADSTQLALNATDPPIGQQYVGSLRRRKGDDRQTACLVFLNGCATATGSPHGGFLEATARQGFFGFIGTEASVPDVFALRFGLAFMRGLRCQDKALHEVVSVLRTKHWPLSLVYSVNCYADLRLRAIEDRSRLQDWNQASANFSDPPVGSQDSLPWSSSTHP